MATFQQLQNAVLNIRGDSSYLSTDGGIKDAITAREGEIWQFADWPIKNSVQLSLTVTAGTATVAVPAGFTMGDEALDIFDNYGNKIDYLRPELFFQSYGASPSTPQPNSYPSAWTLTLDPNASGALVFRFGPTPIQSTTFSVSGWNLPIKRTAAAVWQIGTMSANSDIPWWPDAYHYFIVDGAIARLKRQFGDPSWQADEAAFSAGLDRLRDALLPLERSSLEQWGDYWSPYAC